MDRHASVVLAGLLLLAAILDPVTAVGTELNCMISVYGSWDYEFNGGTSPCIHTVEMAKKRCGGTRLNFVPTHFWVDESGKGTVDYYCYRVAGGECKKVTQVMVDAFTNGIQKCMAQAVALGYSIEITPHLDDGLGKGGWRNALVFDPLKPYGGMTYADIMVKPLAQALSVVIQPTTKVWFATQGEMSATVMRFPQSWAALIPKVKAWVAGPTAAAQAQVEVGISTNFNKLCACVLMNLVDPELYLRKLPEALKPLKKQFNLPAIADLYDQVDFIGMSNYASMFVCCSFGWTSSACPTTPPCSSVAPSGGLHRHVQLRLHVCLLLLQVDFIGMSNYASMPAAFTNEDLENAARQFATEAKEFGIDLDTLLTKKGKKLHFSEYGVGGGTCGTGDCPAKTPTEAAKTPFFGIFGVYSQAKDPWQTPAVRTWLRKFYDGTISWLKTNGGPKYKVEALYMWNLASWDVVGIHGSSTSAEGSYFDAEVSAAILEHNAAVMAAKPKVPTVVTRKPSDEIPTSEMPIAEADNKTSNGSHTDPKGAKASASSSLLNNFFKVDPATDQEPRNDTGTAVEANAVTADSEPERSPRMEDKGHNVTPEGEARLQKKIEEARKALRDTSNKVNAAVGGTG